MQSFDHVDVERLWTADPEAFEIAAEHYLDWVEEVWWETQEKAAHIRRVDRLDPPRG